MLIQIIGLREYFDKKTGKYKKADRFFEKGWRLNSIQEVFGPEAQALIGTIPEEERYNLYYTAAHCFEDGKRNMREMRIIPFDIDSIEYTEDYKGTCMRIATCVSIATGVPVEKLGVLFSGNGVQVIVSISNAILDTSYFDQYRKHYGVICAKIEAELRKANIKGDIDPTVFDDSRILRLPHTLNRKKDKPERMAEVVQSTIQPVEWDIIAISGVTEIGAEVIPDDILKNYPKPDTEAVIAECGFIQHCKNKPAIIKEYEWYAMVSITSRLQDGELVTHKLSEGHPQYNSFETDAKIKQALASAGPRTCANIATMWDGCKQCKYWSQIKSPIQIKGQDYIASQDFGYRERSVSANGTIKPGRPAYDDIIKQFSIEYNYRTMAGTGQVFIFNGVYWEEMELYTLRNWLGDMIVPSPSRTESEEAIYRIKSANVVSRDSMLATSKGLLNFTNGVYDVFKNTLVNHGPEFGFFNVIPYAYDPTAECPKWDRYLSEAMLGRKPLVDALMQFAGYCLSYDSCWAEKCLVLKGGGSNGKSVFMEVIHAVLGKDNASSIQMSDVIKEKTARMNLVNKLVNYSDESGKDIFKDSAMFKSLVHGGQMTVKKLFVQEAQVENRTKFILSCNELPSTSDNTHAFFRRFLIIPFDHTISPQDEGFNPFLKDELVREELPGICNQMISYYRKLMETHRFIVPQESIDVVEEYKRMESPVQLFIEECIQKTGDDKDFLSSAEMYAKYTMYCDENNYRRKTSMKFHAEVGHILNKSTVQKKINNKVIRGREGIRYEASY